MDTGYSVFLSSCPSHLEGILLLWGDFHLWPFGGDMNRYWVVDLHRFGQHHFGKLFHLPLPMGICSNKPNFSEPLGTPKQKTTNQGLLVTKVTTIAVKLLVVFLPWPHGPAPMALQMHLTSEGGPYRHRFMAERCPKQPEIRWIYTFTRCPMAQSGEGEDCYFAQGCLW